MLCLLSASIDDVQLHRDNRHFYSTRGIDPSFPGRSAIVNFDGYANYARGSLQFFEGDDGGSHRHSRRCSWHFFDDGEGINQVPLNALVGPAKAYDLTGLDCITASRLADLDIDGGARVLFKTSNADLWKRSEAASDYVALTADAADFLVHRGVRAVGIDYLSVDRPHQSDFPVHHLLLKHRVSIIEGLNLRHVCADEYFLICLPLKFSNAEAAPARAVLLQ